MLLAAGSPALACTERIVSLRPGFFDPVGAARHGESAAIRRDLRTNCTSS